MILVLIFRGEKPQGFHGEGKEGAGSLLTVAYQLEENAFLKFPSLNQILVHERGTGGFGGPVMPCVGGANLSGVCICVLFV